MNVEQAQSEQFAALLSNVENAPEWLQTNIAQRLAITPSTQDNQQTAAAVTEMMAAAQLPLGNDAMVATPTALGTQLERDELQLAQQNGRTTHTDEDIERMTFAIEAQVKQMIAAGATDADIKIAVGNLPNVTPELSQLAQQIAQQQLDAEKFNLFSQREQQAQQQEPEKSLSLGDLLTTPMMALAAGEKAKEPEAEKATSDPFASLLAGLEISRELRDLNSPTAGLSNLLTTPAQQRERDGGMGVA